MLKSCSNQFQKFEERLLDFYLYEGHEKVPNPKIEAMCLMRDIYKVNGPDVQMRRRDHCVLFHFSINTKVRSYLVERYYAKEGNCYPKKLAYYGSKHLYAKFASRPLHFVNLGQMLVFVLPTNKILTCRKYILANTLL